MEKLRKGEKVVASAVHGTVWEIISLRPFIVRVWGANGKFVTDQISKREFIERKKMMEV